MLRALRRACRRALVQSPVATDSLACSRHCLPAACAAPAHTAVQSFAEEDGEERSAKRLKSRKVALSWTSRPPDAHADPAAERDDGDAASGQWLEGKPERYCACLPPGRPHSRALRLHKDTLAAGLTQPAAANAADAGRHSSSTGAGSRCRQGEAATAARPSGVAAPKVPVLPCALPPPTAAQAFSGAQHSSRFAGKFRPPDGGNGGRGGDVWLEADPRVKSLAGLSHMQRAGPGSHGGRQKLTGQTGRDCVLKVPLGTVVFARPEDDSAGPAAASHQWDVDPAAGFGSGSESEPEAAEGESLGEQLSRRLGDEVADLSQPGQRFLAAAGGEGGRGNAVAPSRAGREEDRSGAAGQRRVVTLEVRVLADVGLVGAPNAGKSSLLRALSAAEPKVAPYPFTTLRPHLGSVRYGDLGAALTVADIPGLIPGAADDRGLGHAFLRHVSRARALVLVVDAAAGLPPNADAPRPWEQLAGLQAELARYSPELAQKPALVVANKIDLLARPEATLAAIRRRTHLPVIPTAAIRGSAGLGSLKDDLAALIGGMN